MRYNPFRPGGIVSPGMFCGRVEEIEAVEQSLNQTRFGNPQHFLLEGERGIGKSSLMLLARIYAEGEVGSAPKFRFLVLNIELNNSTTDLEFIRKIGTAFRNELKRRQHLLTLAKIAWDWLTKWKVLGVEFRNEHQNIDAMEALDALVEGFAGFLTEVGNEVDGILILVDEADKPDPANANLGQFVKLFTEKMAKLRCERVCLGFAGLPITIQKLREGHESSLRVFQTYMLEPLNDAESRDVIQRGLAEANSKNDYKTRIEDDAEALIVHLAEGYPHFIQQFAFCAFDQDKDGVIDIADVRDAAYKENGALDQLGRKYFQELYFDKIASDDYRKVLDAMAEHLDQWVSRQKIIQSSGVKETTVTNALGALKSRNIILVNEERKGEYRLPTKSFAVWIKAVNSRNDVG